MEQLHHVLALAQSIFAFDLIRGQAADAGQGASAVGDDDGNHDLIAAGGVGDADLHGVEMAADVGGVLVAEGDADGGAHAAAFLGAGDEGGAFFDGAAQWGAEFGMEDGGGVFKFAVLSNDGGLFIRLKNRRIIHK